MNKQQTQQQEPYGKFNFYSFFIEMKKSVSLFSEMSDWSISKLKR